MLIKRCKLLRLHTPFKQSFTHSQSERGFSDKILLILETAAGHSGYGEVLARSYVSGETNDQVFTESGPALAAILLGQEFKTLEQLQAYLKQLLASGEWGPAVIGGFELALLNVFAQTNMIDVVQLLGPNRTSKAGRCLTIGFECSNEQIRRYAMQARLTAASVVKLKVGLRDDVQRIRAFNAALKGQVPLRLDANGCLDLDQAIALLNACQGLPIESLEQPFAADAIELEAKLETLYKHTNIPLMADESLCTESDAAHWIATQSYQIFNIRIGKCGGLLNAVHIRDMALQAGIEIVAGTMVGESGVLNWASELFLQHSEALQYVEGLGQNKSFLQQDPVDVVPVSENPLGARFSLIADIQEQQRASQLIE